MYLILSKSNNVISAIVETVEDYNEQFFKISENCFYDKRFFLIYKNNQSQNM